MIALPFHPSNGFEIRERNNNLDEILHGVEEAKKLIKNPDLHLNLWKKVHDGALYADQATIAGCPAHCGFFHERRKDYGGR